MGGELLLRRNVEQLLARIAKIPGIADLAVDRPDVVPREALTTIRR